MLYSQYEKRKQSQAQGQRREQTSDRQPLVSRPEEDVENEDAELRKQIRDRRRRNIIIIASISLIAVFMIVMIIAFTGI